MEARTGPARGAKSEKNNLITNMIMNDEKTTISELKEVVRKFRDERDWQQFHGPKNMAESLCVEAGELLELFLWIEREEVSRKLKDVPEYKEEVAHELADVIYNCLAFALDADIDIADAFSKKMVKTTQKYPVEKSKGQRTKFNWLKNDD